MLSSSGRHSHYVTSHSVLAGKPATSAVTTETIIVNAIQSQLHDIAHTSVSTDAAIQVKLGPLKYTI